VGRKANAAPDRVIREESGESGSSDGENAELPQQPAESADQDAALPIDNMPSGLGSTSAPGWKARLAQFSSTPWFEFFESIAILTQLIRYRDCLTPDFIHFVTCVVEDEAHFVCITLYWLFWKCFLTIDPNLVNKYDTKRRVEDRVKIVARALIELAVSLILTSG
jgi:hypothetical protein